MHIVYLSGAIASLMSHLPRYFFMLLSCIVCGATKAQQPSPGIQWQRCIGGTLAEAGNALAPTKDAGYVIAGSAKSNDGDFKDNRSKEDYAIIKTDSLGKVLWTRNYGGDNVDIATSIRVAKNGGYIVAGSTNSLGGDVLNNNSSTSDATDYWLLKLTETGLLEWAKAYGGTNYEYAYAIDNAHDGGFIAVGESSSNDVDVVGNHGNGDCWILKVDRNGLVQWQRSMGGSNLDVGRSVKATPDSGYIVAGFSFSSNGDVLHNNRSGNIWIIKLDASGKEEWQKSIGGSLPDYAYDIEPVSDGGYIISGIAYSNDGDISGNHGGADCIVVKLGSKGDTQWINCFGGTQDDVGQSVKETGDGSFIVAGYTKSNDGNVSGAHGDVDAWVIKLNKQGVLQWQKPLGGSKPDRAGAVLASNDGSIVVVGSVQSNNGDVSGNHSNDADIWLVKMNCLPVMPSIEISAERNPVCIGFNTSFTASIQHGGNQPIYQWMKNGQPVGSNTSTYTTNDLKQDDELYCILTSSDPCVTQSTASSNKIRMHIVAVDAATQPTLSIVASNNFICEGSATHFTATATNSANVSSFRWMINDLLMPDTGREFITSSLQPGDVVKAGLVISNACANSISSNPISIIVYPTAEVTCMNDSAVAVGTMVQLRATVSGIASSYTWFANGTVISNLQSPVVTVDKTTTYQLKVTSLKDCVTADEVTITVLKKLSIPNAFSPNGDGINDTWLIRGVDPTAHFRVQIFDRFGKSIAEFKADALPWDGTYNGRTLPVGVYYYVISSPTAASYKGALTILR
jgi:gliding motility-associated-like protein